jgi:hypothetical protein
VRFITKRKVDWLTWVALAVLLFIGVSVWPRSTAASPMPVRFVEGVVHGFLVLRTLDGDPIASGDLRQVNAGENVTSHMVFAFKDGSVFDETVTFTQGQVFTMQRYHLIQRGPVFPKDSDITLERASGKYTVKTKDHDDGKEDVEDGTLELPSDIYNGMIFTILKNLEKGVAGTIHVVTFTPKAQIIELALLPISRERISAGNASKTANKYILRPKLGTARKLLATLAGRVPPDNHAWILADEVPTFVSFQGPLFMGGPVWRIELTSPEIGSRGHAEQ